MAGGGQITVELTIQEEKMLASVTDNGVGRKSDPGVSHNGKQHNSLGTQLTKERLALLSDQYHKEFHFEIIDQHSSGVKVNIWMPFEVE
jgi:two-component sensor histidine kinase